jgi:hypothetical protein
MIIKELIHHLGNYFIRSPYSNSHILSSSSPISHFPSPKPHSGFTIVEILIVAPIVILVIGVFVSTIVSMTGEVLATRAANTLAYNTQEALNLIEQDVKLSGAFLATNNIALISPQGYDNSTANFHNADATNGAMLILNIYATTSNPLSATRGLVYASDQPNSCNSTLINQNLPVMLNVVYFVKNSTLWRRVIAPSYYATIGCVNSSIGAPWQQPSCAPSASGVFCKTQDMRLVDGIASDGFSVKYYPSPSSTTENATASNSALSDSVRQTALLANSTVAVAITATNTTAGREISQAGTIRAVSPNNNINKISLVGMKVLDNSDTVASWASSDAINFVPSQDTTDKKEGTGSINMTANLPQVAYIQGYWKMEEASGNALDISGNNNTLIANSPDTIASAVGKIGNARDLSGTTEFFETPDVSQTGLDITGEITIAAWIKLDSNAVDNMIVTKWDNSGGAKKSYRLSVDSTRVINFIIRDPIAGDVATSSTTVLSLGSWYHVVATLNQSTDLIQVYINGLANGPAVSATGNIQDTTTDFCIGCWHNPGEQRFPDGIIDEVVVWNKALTAGEISQVYLTMGNDALNDTLTRDLGASTKDLSGYNSVSFWVKSTRAGSYMQFGIGESTWNNNTTNFTVNSADNWEQKTFDISGIVNANKDAIRYLGFKVTNNDSNFTFKFDDINANY